MGSIRGRPKESPDCYFEILGKLDENGQTSVIKGCKTNHKGMVVQGKMIEKERRQRGKRGREWSERGRGRAGKRKRRR